MQLKNNLYKHIPYILLRRNNIKKQKYFLKLNIVEYCNCSQFSLITK